MDSCSNPNPGADNILARLARALAVFATGPGQHRLVHRLPSDRFKGSSCRRCDERCYRPRKTPLVEGQEVGLFQPEPSFH